MDLTFFFGVHGKTIAVFFANFGLVGLLGVLAFLVLAVWGSVGTMGTTCRFFGITTAICSGIALVLALWIRVDSTLGSIVGGHAGDTAVIKDWIPW